jgi:hypothetical protein
MIRKIAFSILAASLLLVGCKPEPKGEVGTPFDKVAGFSGTWKITSFTQQDLNNPIKETRDLSDFYVVEGEEPIALTFNSDKTYSVQLGPGKNYFGEGGSWSFDNNDYPSFLLLYTATDTLQLSLGSVVREFDNDLSLRLPRTCTDSEGNVTNTVIYSFNFARQ